jgi:[ribosomal protein S5]-alanine N-acetyltransferase
MFGLIKMANGKWYPAKVPDHWPDNEIQKQMTSFQFFPFPVLKTENLVLRQLSAADAAEIFALRSNEQVNKYLDRNKAKSLEDAITFIDVVNRNIANNESIYWGLQHKDDTQVIGTICLYNLSCLECKGEIGYELLPAVQGRGFMQEAILEILGFAFKKMQLKTIEAWTVKQNLASVRLLEKNGFVVDVKAYDNMTEAERKAGSVIYILTS